MEVVTANIILYCKNWSQVVTFYEEILGFERSFANQWFVEFRINVSTRLSVANDDRATIKSASGQGITIALQVKDVQAMHKSLEETGLQPSPIKKRWRSEVFYIFDPEGNRLEFWT